MSKLFNTKIQRSYDIKLLSDCPHHFLNLLAELWQQEIGRHWVPEESIVDTQTRFFLHANKDILPLMYVAVDKEQPIGMACLRSTEGILPELTPWIGGLVVHPQYRKLRVVLQLVRACVRQAKKMGYSIIYLLAFDKALAVKYQRIMHCEIIGTELVHEEPVIVMKFSSKIWKDHGE